MPRVIQDAEGGPLLATGGDDGAVPGPSAQAGCVPCAGPACPGGAGAGTTSAVSVTLAGAADVPVAGRGARALCVAGAVPLWRDATV